MLWLIIVFASVVAISAQNGSDILDLKRILENISATLGTMVTRKEFVDQMANMSSTFHATAALRHHEYVPEFAAVLEKSSSPIKCTINGTNHFHTEHSLFFDGFVFTLGVKHGICYKELGIRHIAYADIDVIVRCGCPVTPFVLNVNSYVALRTGDEASTLGYVDDSSRFWHGRLSGRLQHKLIINDTVFNSDEYLFEGVTQIAGMSGGATLNGVGYTGMVHGTNLFGTPAPHLAVVIPASIILSTFRDINASVKAQELKMLDDCPGVTVLQIPRY